MLGFEPSKLIKAAGYVRFLHRRLSGLWSLQTWNLLGPLGRSHLCSRGYGYNLALFVLVSIKGIASNHWFQMGPRLRRSDLHAHNQIRSRQSLTGAAGKKKYKANFVFEAFDGTQPTELLTDAPASGHLPPGRVSEEFWAALIVVMAFPKSSRISAITAGGAWKPEPGWNKP